MSQTIFDLQPGSAISASLGDFMKNNIFPKSLLCFSHLRWDFVFQRPQHIMTTLSKDLTVHYVEEPVFVTTENSFWVASKRDKNVWVYVPHVRKGLDEAAVNREMKALLDIFFLNRDTSDFIFWYYTPMAMDFTEHLTAGLTVYDCMDELSAFKFAPGRINSLENKLLAKSDIVFTGGRSLYEAKKNMHRNIHLFPSSIDKKHFMKGREPHIEPQDQVNIPGPKIGFYGVIDERLDIALIEALAIQRPDWNFILIGPVVKIDPATLPTNENIHYLGPKSYEQLPNYLSGWNVALVPFVIDKSTRFVSPTKTPEYLCAGKPVVSTPIQDIINPYGVNMLVSVADNPDLFMKAIEYWLTLTERTNWQCSVDKFLLAFSWDITCSEMLELMSKAYAAKRIDTILHAEPLQKAL